MFCYEWAQQGVIDVISNIELITLSFLSINVYTRYDSSSFWSSSIDDNNIELGIHLFLLI